MKRTIITIDRDKCNGCGICVDACHEGAIQLVDGKAQLIRDDYCDGLGDCLPSCPTNAIAFIEREAQPYDEKAVQEHLKSRAQASAEVVPQQQESALTNWPVQIKLAPTSAPYFDGCDLLIAADCSAFAYGAFHRDFMQGKVCLIACPKLDGVDYSEKLSQIFALNNIKSIQLTRMTVPCCGGLEFAIKKALEACGKDIPFTVTTFDTKGTIV